MSIKLPLLLLSFGVLLTMSGCANLEENLRKAEGGLDLYDMTKDVSAFVSKNDSKQALQDLAKKKGEQYVDDPRALIRDLRKVKREYDKLISLLEGNVSKNWGKKETKIPTKKRYVKYTQNYKSRAIVDFDSGLISVETMRSKNWQASLENAVITTLLTPEDPRSVDLFSDKEIKLSGHKTPYLKGLVVDQSNNAIDSPKLAERFAKFMVSKKAASRKIKSDSGTETIHYVNFFMVSNFSDKQANKYKKTVERYAKKYKISRSLVFAVIKQESNFNPHATSHIPAYGLMQLVPSSGGRDAYKKVRGKDKAPSRDYLYDPKKNIELGTAYLNIINYQYLKHIHDKTSREYCVIAAYNTGSGNVLKTFAKGRSKAIDQINQMKTSDVYTTLINDLPYEETRTYLAKVVQHRKKYLDI